MHDLRTGERSNIPETAVVGLGESRSRRASHARARVHAPRQTDPRAINR